MGWCQELFRNGGFIKAIPSIISFLLVLIALFTLKEMKKQRQQSYQPRLLFQNRYIFLQKNSNGTPCFLKKEYEFDSNSYPENPIVKLKNIGLGSAHTITITWKYNSRKLIEEFNKLGKETDLLYFDRDTHFEFIYDKTMRENDEGYKGYGFTLCHNEEYKINSISPDEILEIGIPDTVKNYITFASFLKSLKDGKLKRTSINIISFNVYLSFYDIGGRLIKNNQNIEIDLTVVPENKEGNYGYGEMKFSTFKRRLLNSLKSHEDK